MGEFPFSDHPGAEWPEKLRKIRASGVTVVAADLRLTVAPQGRCGDHAALLSLT
ncbi:hypothetical protein [Spongiactinospora sp. 9N601]|uniref:hypothetical protein n=1 Tax=Spongiactinospora sp. 9N601 TaxID=3375149 RepID=UPI0037ABC39A